MTTSRKSPTVAARRAELLRRFTEGELIADIADDLGMSAATARRDLTRAFADLPWRGALQARAVQVGRLDRLIGALSEQAMAGDHRAARELTRAIATQSRLLGLDRRAVLEADVDAAEAARVPLDAARGVLGEFMDQARALLAADDATGADEDTTTD